MMKNTKFYPILMHFAARHAGYSYAEFASDYKFLVNANLKVIKDFGVDYAGLISDPYRETSAFGAPVEYVKEGVPKCTELVVKNMDDVNDLRNPDVYRAERTLDRINAAKALDKELKGNIPIIGWVEGPLAEACDLAGISEMLTYLMMDTDFANKLMDKCMITAKDFAKAQIDNGCQVIGIGDAVCSQIDSMLYSSFVKDRHEELVSYIHDNGARVKMHICGDITHLLPSLSEIGIDIIDLDWQVDLENARKICGDEITVSGNINPVVIQDKNSDEIYNLSRELIKSQQGKNFILSGGCEITVDTPPENLISMKKACENHD